MSGKKAKKKPISQQVSTGADLDQDLDSTNSDVLNGLGADESALASEPTTLDVAAQELGVEEEGVQGSDTSASKEKEDDGEPDPEDGEKEAKGSGDGSGDEEGEGEAEEKDADAEEKDTGEDGEGGDGGDGDAPEEVAVDEGGLSGGGGSDGGDGGPGISDAQEPVVSETTQVKAPPKTSFSMPNVTDDVAQAYTQMFGMTPNEASQKISGDVQEVVDESVALADEIQAAAEGTSQAIVAQTQGISGEVKGIIDAGRGEVTSAFLDVAAKSAAGATQGIATVQSNSAAARASIDSIQATGLESIGAKFTAAEAKLGEIKTKGKVDYTAAIQTGASSLDEIAKGVKAAAVETGKAKASELTSKIGSAAGIAALELEVSAGIAKDVAKQAGAAIDMRVKVLTRQRGAEEANQVVEASTKNEMAAIQTTLDGAKKNIQAAHSSAIPKIAGGEKTAVDTLEGIRDGVEARAMAEDVRAQARLDAAESYLTGETAAMGTELSSAVVAEGAKGADIYMDIAHTVGEEVGQNTDLVSPTSPAPTLQRSKEMLSDAHDENSTRLDGLEQEGGTTLQGGLQDKISLFEDSVVDQKAQATVFEQTVNGEISGAVDGFSGVFSAQETAMKTVADVKMAPVESAIESMAGNAQAALEQQKTQVNTTFEGVKAELQAVSDSVLGTIDQAIETSKAKKVNDKRLAILSKDIPAVYSAMDGWGTDEKGIFSSLRNMGPGHVRAFESLWNQRKSRSIRWYFNDEMSGSDLSTALAYLNGNRAKALNLELKASQGTFNDDEARIEEVMRSASAEELATLNGTYAATMDSVKGCLGGADLDAFNTLADESLSREDAKLQTDAIRLHEAMDGWGTDEAKVKSVLEGAKTPEEREKLRSAYNAYAKTQGDMHGLDADLRGDFSGAEEQLVLVLSKKDRTEAEVAAAKVHEATDGMGTSEKDVFKALKHDKEGWDKQLTSLQEQLVAAQSTGDKMKMEELQIQMEDIQAKQQDWANIDQHLANVSGGSETNMHALLRSEMGGLELKIAEDTLDKGQASRADMLILAGKGWGTDEAFAKEALTDDQGNPLSKEELAKIDAELAKSDSGYSSIEQFRDGELGGKDAHDVEKLELGKPETAADYKKLSDMEYAYSNSGFGGFIMDIKGAVGASTAKEEMNFAKDKFDEQYATMEDSGVANMTFDQLVQTDPEASQLIQELGITSVASSEAYAKSLSSTVDALVTTLEIVAGIIATVVTAGTASPYLAAVLSSLIITSSGAILKKGLVGDQYGYDQMLEDIARAVVAAPIGVYIGKVEKIGKIAEATGAKAGEVMSKAGMKAGLDMTSEGFLLNPKAIQYVQTFVQAGTKNSIEEAASDSFSALTSEDNIRALYGADDKKGSDYAEDVGTYVTTTAVTNFVTGGASEVYSEYRTEQKKNAFVKRMADQNITLDEDQIKSLDTSYLTWGSETANYANAAVDMFANATIKHVGNVQNYSDAEQFWGGFVDIAAGSPKKMFDLMLKQYGSRIKLQMKIEKDLKSGALKTSQFNLMATEMTEEELIEIGSKLPPSRQPTSVKTLMDSRVSATFTTSYDGDVGGSLVLDLEKLKTASTVELAQLLASGTDWTELESTLSNRDLDPSQRLYLAQNSGSNNKMPADFLEPCKTQMVSGTLSDQMTIASDIGWQHLPTDTKTAMLAALDSGTPGEVTGAMAAFKGQVPPEVTDKMMTALSRNNTGWDEYHSVHAIDDAGVNQDVIKMIEGWDLSEEEMKSMSPEVTASLQKALQAQKDAADTPKKKYAMMTSKYGAAVIASDTDAVREVGTYLVTELTPVEVSLFYNTYRNLPDQSKSIIRAQMIEHRGLEFNESGELVKYERPTFDPSVDYENHGSE